MPLRRCANAALAAGVIAATVNGCAVDLAALPGCSERDERLATVLAASPILASAPASAVPTNSYSGCDTDDGFAHAGRQYRTHLDREDIMSFYRRAAIADGWQADGEDPTPVPSSGQISSRARGCFHKQIDGTAAYLTGWFPADFRPHDDRASFSDLHGVSITGSHDGDARC